MAAVRDARMRSSNIFDRLPAAVLRHSLIYLCDIQSFTRLYVTSKAFSRYILPDIFASTYTSVDHAIQAMSIWRSWYIRDYQHETSSMVSSNEEVDVSAMVPYTTAQTRAALNATVLLPWRRRYILACDNRSFTNAPQLRHIAIMNPWHTPLAPNAATSSLSSFPTFTTPHTYHRLYRIAIFGDVRCGIDSLMTRLIDDTYIDTRPLHMIALDFRITRGWIHQQAVKLQIWDQPGRGARYGMRERTIGNVTAPCHAIIYMIDRDRWNESNWHDRAHDIQNKLAQLMTIITEKARTDIPMAIFTIVVTKCDIPLKDDAASKNYRAFVETLRFFFLLYKCEVVEVSSLEVNGGVHRLFRNISHQIMTRWNHTIWDPNKSVLSTTPSPSSSSPSSSSSSKASSSRCVIM